LIAAQYAGISIDVPAFEFAKDNETADFKAKFPTQKVPALDTPNGPIFESNAMARYGMCTFDHVVCMCVWRAFGFRFLFSFISF
jgi:hypothetical protein